MHFLVYGAGGVGGTLAGGLTDGGHEVGLVARGEHGAALAEHGLTLARPGGTSHHTLHVAASATEARLADLDAILLCVKSQDTATALADLVRAGATDLPLICAQNGVDNERVAAQQFAHVYGMMVWMPACHLEPGQVAIYAADPPAVLRVGRFPTGLDDFGERLAAALRDAGFDTEAVDNIDAWKHAKLLLNLGNALDAFCEPVPRDHPFRTALEAEALSILRTAQREVLPRELLLAATASMKMGRIDGHKREGGSTWQSAMRGRPDEVGHLNGALCRLAEQYGTAAPCNAAMVELAQSRPAPRSVAIDDLPRP